MASLTSAGTPAPSGKVSGPVNPKVAALIAVVTAMSDRTRVDMLRLMLEYEEVACAALEATYNLTKSTISYHVRMLRDAGLIHVRKAGKFYFYSLRREVVNERFPGLLDLIATTPLPEMKGAPAPDATDDHL